MIVAIALVLVTVGTVVFHFMSPWWWTPIASNWGGMDDTITLTFWVTGFVFVAVLLFTAYCVVRFRYREGVRAEYKPEDSKLEWWLTGITTLGVIGLLTPGLFVWADFVTVPKNAMEFEAMGQQWSWSFRLPGKDGILGTTSPRYIDDDNPYGITPSDPNGKDDILVDGDELHLPLDQPVKALLRSIDVLHDFYVPEFRAKMDLIPGMVTHFWLTPTRTGTFDLLCFELCGVGHYAMRGKVVVEEKAAYEAWLKTQPTFAQSLAKAKADAKDGVQLVLSEGRAEPPKTSAAQ